MEAGQFLDYRLTGAEKKLDDFGEWRRRVDQGAIEQKAEQRAMHQDIEEIRAGQQALAKKQDALMRTIIGAAGAVALAAITFALTVLAGTGKI